MVCLMVTWTSQWIYNKHVQLGGNPRRNQDKERKDYISQSVKKCLCLCVCVEDPSLPGREDKMMQDHSQQRGQDGKQVRQEANVNEEESLAPS